MSDEIIEDLRRTAADDGRPLGFGAAEVLRVGRSRRRRRRVFGGSATALGVAVAAVATWAVLPTAFEDRSEPASPTGDSDTVPLDRGPMSEAEVQNGLDFCAQNIEDQTIFYARRVDSSSGARPALLAIVRRADGSVYSCGSTWAARGVNRLTATPDPAHPIVSIATEGIGTNLEGAWLEEGGFYRVADSVARVETRVGTPDGSEPWRVSTPHHGVVFWSAWIEEGAYDADDEVWLEWRAYDTDGNRIDPALMPDQPQLIDPTGSNEIAAEYDEISRLLSQVALDRLQTERGSLEGGSVRYGSRDDAGWASVTTQLYWSPWGRTLGALVELSLSRPGAYTDDELRDRIGCQARFECQRVDLGDQGWAWVGENDAGSIGVGHVQPDGEIAYIVIDTEDPLHGNPEGEVDITVDEALDFVTDDRLDLPTR